MNLLKYLPKGFDLKINLKQALANAAGAVLVLKVALAVTEPTTLIIGGLFGLFGGSINDIVGWRRNQEAISKNETTEEK